MDNTLHDPEENYKSGYIKVYRSLKSHWLYEQRRKRTKYEAWIDLLLMAQHDQKKEPVGYDLILVNRGQILTSQDRLSREWKWDRSAVRLFLNSLHEDQMLTIETTNKYTMITICNYDTYQVRQPTEQQQTHQQTITTSTHTNNDNKLKKNIKGNKLPLSDAEKGFIKLVNDIANRKFKSIDSATRRNFKSLLDDGYNGKDFRRAISNAFREMSERGKHGYLTPEFIVRTAEFQKYVDMPDPKPLNNKKNNDETIYTAPTKLLPTS